ncbi:PLP-dependent aminotransferase family protein [Paenibacillus hamazuiensis]|uniref:MocR-like pyridoxine biosynthesis transcription factor PdxR n=1 Tax=Paenibacillus hamazuiensis TaxID=2936508 RepID=UPI00200CF163|nr:PLP-dependent aminotransferase family protein [Paenibacillus hamazuiensis]
MWKPDRNDNTPLYRQISEYIGQRIRYGEYPPGHKLPSERKLAAELQVNRSTVVQAYEELRAAGLIESAVGFGTRVAAGKWGIAPKPALNWHAYEKSGSFLPNVPLIRRIREQIRANPGLIDFASGELSPDLFPNESFQRLWRGNPYTGHLGYDDPQGYEPLRETLANFLREYHGIRATASSILITSGSQQSLFLITQCLLSPGDAVAIEDPSYCYSLPMFQSAGLRIFPLPVADEHGIDPGHLISLHRQHRIRMIFVNPNFQNPTGTVLSPPRRVKLLETAAELGIPVVEDDPFSLTAFNGHPPAPLKALDTAGNVIYIGSLSKIAASGFRIGWMAAPHSVVRRLADARQQMDFGLSAIPQWIAAKLLDSTADFEAHLASLRQALLHKRNLLVSALNEQFEGSVEFDIPQGGLTLWCKMTAPAGDEQLLEKAVRRGVVYMPGSVYGSGRGYVRLSFARPSSDKIADGVSRLADAVRSPH